MMMAPEDIEFPSCWEESTWETPQNMGGKPNSPEDSQSV